ncbi:MAG TPA: ATP-binding cassette domain-containing protein [Thermomicrobiales bacterium]|nr:ATP-binding cassette domain-containing protein [Thermomicrobiales bacterium]
MGDPESGLPPPALRIAGLTKAYAGNVVLRDVGMTVLAGEIHALVGENGAGKSTLINLVTGVVQPDAGPIQIGGEPAPGLTPRIAEARGVATVHQELSLCPHLSVAENVFLGKAPTRFGRLDYARMASGAQAALAGLGVAIDPRSLAGDLSLADQQLVEIAKALAAGPRLLILDEATSALDAGQVARLFAALRRLRDGGVAVVFVSHRMEEIFAISDRITVLKDGAHVATVPAAGTTAADLVRLMVGRELRDAFPPKPSPVAIAAAPVVLSVRGLSSGRRFRDVSFDLHRGEILGLGGLQGQGQRELLAALFGLHPVQGEVLLDGAPATVRGPRAAMGRRIAHVPEDRKTEGLIVQLPVADNLSLPSLPDLDRFGLLDPARERGLVAGLIEKLRIRLRSPKQSLLRLSGGNQQKVAIAKWLPLEPEIYLLAEPTRGIDVGTKQEIYGLMRELTAAGAAILLISSDTIELLGLSDRVLVMYERRPVALLAGAEVTEENVVHAAVVGRWEGPDDPHPSASEAPTNGTAVPSSQAVPPRTATAVRSSTSRRLPRAWQDVAPIFGVTLLFALAYAFLTRETLSLGTITNLAAYLFPLFLVAMAQAVVMLTGGIDLAVGQMMSLATVVLATQMVDSPVSKVSSVALVLLGGALLGTLTGAVVTLIKLPAIIVTLATSFIWAGWALYVLNVPGGHLPVSFAQGFTGRIGGLVPATLAVLAATLVLWKLLKTSPLGLAIYAVGDNPRGAYVSGLPVRAARIAAYAVAGAMTALAGIGLTAYAATGDPLIGAPYSLASIAAAVLGGVGFFGGQGQLKGAVAGALTLGLMTQILFISGLSPAYQRVIYGAVLVVALGVRAFAAYRIEEAR